MTLRPASVAPLLVFGWGNPSRGDDALGPMFVEQLNALLDNSCAGSVDFLTDYQLQVEHSLDLQGREQVLFVDASLNCEAPFEITTLQPLRDASFTTHAMSPAAVMRVYCQLHGTPPPPCTLLAIRAERFGLGEPPSDTALANLAHALMWGQRWLPTQACFNSAASASCTS